VGVSVFGLVILCVNSAECLQDLYVNKNALVTKHSSSSRAWSIIMPQSILFQHTHAADYSDKRKALSSAFFKQKLLMMHETIKHVTINRIKSIQASGQS